MASNSITRICYSELNIQPLWYSGVRCLNTGSRGFDCLDKAVEQHAGLSSDESGIGPPVGCHWLNQSINHSISTF